MVGLKTYLWLGRELPGLLFLAMMWNINCIYWCHSDMEDKYEPARLSVLKQNFINIREKPPYKKLVYTFFHAI